MSHSEQKKKEQALGDCQESIKREPRVRKGDQEGTVTRKDRGKRRPSHPQVTPRDHKQEGIKKNWLSSLLPDTTQAKV